jgi:hypothetical protein
MRHKLLILPVLCSLLQLMFIPIVFAADSCADKAANLQKEHNGKILSIKSANQEGASVCVIDILVPGKNGNPPRKKRFQVKQ